MYLIRKIILPDEKNNFFKGDLKMTKVKDALSKKKAIMEIYSKEEQILEGFKKISKEVNIYPDQWIESINKNYSSFLVYIRGITEKYEEEIKKNSK